MSLKYSSNASKLHREVGDVLSNSSFFKNFVLLQEYPLSNIKGDESNKMKYDWAIPQLKIVIECHGKQHYEVTNFGNTEYQEAINSFKRQKKRDEYKRDLAFSSGWIYLEIPYTLQGKITEDVLLDAYSDGRNFAQEYTINEKKKKPKREIPKAVQEKQEELKAKAKEYRRKQYQRAKEWRKQNGK